jgi:hypothetical protein
MSDDVLSTLIPYFGCLIHPSAEGVELTGASRNHLNAAAITPRTYRAPFTLRAVAKTDSTNVRLYWHLGEIILNWECSVRQLRVHDPETGRQQGIEGRGFIEVGAWHEIVWATTADAMRLVVDGEERFAGSGHYADIEAPLGIGPCFGSTIVVRELSITASAT